MDYTEDIYCPNDKFDYLARLTGETWTFASTGARVNGILIN